MEVNGESIYETRASLFESLPWGRSTTRSHILYLHVFDWPADGRLEVPGLLSPASRAYLLADREAELEVAYRPGSAVVSLPAAAPDPVASVVVLEFEGEPEVINAPTIQADGEIFVSSHTVALGPGANNARIRFTLDGSDPDANSAEYDQPITLEQGAVVRCAYFQGGRRVSSVVSRKFTRVESRPAQDFPDRVPGLTYTYYEGEWETLPEFEALTPPLRSGTCASFDLGVRQKPEDFAVRYSGYILVPEDGVYTFFVASDDGSRLWIGDTLVVDNDGLHGSRTESGRIALAWGLHPITVGFFQRTGGMDLEVAFRGPAVEHQVVPPEALFHKR
jgi:alpha-L-fucosidase